MTMFRNLVTFFSRLRLEHVLLFVLLEVSAFAHGYNMFQFPYYENDEGTYMSQAWSVVTTGELAPYTYWYDHAPFGWFLISLWTLMTGGFFTFGMSVNSGRVLMLVLHVVSSYLLYAITRKASGSKLAATVAVIVFSLSPLAIYFQRRVLLDNIMTFWVLLSFYLLTVYKLHLKTVVLSALTFAIAVLTKESALFLVPGVIALFLVQMKREYRIFTIIQWSVIFGSIVSMYVLYALLKGELFPTGSFLGGNQPHVSLIESLQFQASRSNGAPLWDLGKNQFIHELQGWYAQDRFLIGALGVSLFGMSLVSLRKKSYLPFMVSAAAYIFYLARGGNVIEFYILPVIPLAALLIGAFSHELVVELQRMFSGRQRVQRAFAMALPVIVLCALSGYYFQHGSFNRGHNIYTANQTKGQIEAINWIRNHVDEDTVFLFDNYGHIDLRASDNPSGVSYPRAQWYLKVDTDPEVRYDALGGSPYTISMIAMTPQTHHDIEQNKLDFLKKAADQSGKIKTFWSEGWGVEIWESTYPETILSRSWESYKKAFVTKEGRTIDVEKGYQTTSQMQGYSLLRAVWVNDRATFDRLWSWSKANMQKENRLFVSDWGELKDGQWGTKSASTDLSGDTDIALALAFASKKWNDSAYLEEARLVVRGIRLEYVAQIGSSNYLVDDKNTNTKKALVLHLPSLSPYAYRVFKTVDPEYDWNQLLGSSYTALSSCSALSPVFVAPEWCQVDVKGVFTALDTMPTDDAAYTARFQTPWKVALDYQWSHDPRALSLLQKSSFLKNQFESSQRVFMEYSGSGKPLTNWESVAGYAGVIGSLEGESSIADTVYTEKVLARFFQEDPAYVYWEDSDNVFVQNWAWFGTGLYAKSLPNLWGSGAVAQK